MYADLDTLPFDLLNLQELPVVCPNFRSPELEEEFRQIDAEYERERRMERMLDQFVNMVEYFCSIIIYGSIPLIGFVWASLELLRQAALHGNL